MEAAQSRYPIICATIFVASLGAGARPQGRCTKFPALPHEPHVLVVGLADEEVHVEVAEIHLGDTVVAAYELRRRSC